MPRQKFVRTPDGQKVEPRHTEQLMGAWEGDPDAGVPLQNTEVTHATKYAVEASNKGAGGKHLKARKAGGASLLDVTDSGVQASPNGTAAAAPVVNETATQTLTNKTLATTGGNAIAITDQSVDTAGLKDGAVTTPKLAANAVTTAEITDANVTTSKMADGAVTGPKIGAGVIDRTKVDSSVVNQQHGKTTGGLTLTTSYQSVTLDSAVSAPSDGTYLAILVASFDVSGAGDNGQTLVASIRTNTGGEQVNEVQVKGNSGDTLVGVQVWPLSLVSGDSVNVRGKKNGGTGASVLNQGRTSLTLVRMTG